jgi:hypothetical protein
MVWLPTAASSAVRVTGRGPPTGIGKTREAHEKDRCPPVASALHVGIVARLWREEMPFRPHAASAGGTDEAKMDGQLNGGAATAGWGHQLYFKCIDAGIRV